MPTCPASYRALPRIKPGMPGYTWCARVYCGIVRLDRRRTSRALRQQKVRATSAACTLPPTALAAEWLTKSYGIRSRVLREAQPRAIPKGAAKSAAHPLGCKCSRTPLVWPPPSGCPKVCVITSSTHSRAKEGKISSPKSLSHWQNKTLQDDLRLHNNEKRQYAR
jgi:hypothetical protein